MRSQPLGPSEVQEQIPGLLIAGRGNSHPGGKEETMVTFVIAISAVIRSITVSLTLRLRRK